MISTTRRQKYVHFLDLQFIFHKEFFHSVGFPDYIQFFKHFKHFEQPIQSQICNEQHGFCIGRTTKTQFIV